MSSRPTCADTRNATSLPESEGGHLPSSSPNGPKTSPPGPAPAHASLSVPPASSLAPPTNGTSGPSSTASSRSAALQSSLASRLRARLDVTGSPEYELTWKEWGMQSGPPICALRARGRPTSDSGCTGWPTPNTPSGGRSMSPDKMDATGRTADGKKHTASLEHAVKFAGWPTPTVDAKDWSPEAAEAFARGHRGAHHLDLGGAVQLVGWNTPRASDGSNGGPNQAGGALSADAALSGWAPPTSRDHKDGTSEGTAPTNCLLGRQAWLSHAPTGNRGALNPEFSRWLMGYPAAWGSCGATAMQSFRKSPRSSSKHSKKPTQVLEVEL